MTFMPMESEHTKWLNALEKSFDESGLFIRNLSQEEWDAIHPGGWSIEYEANHMLRSIRPINLALILPPSSFSLLGKPNRSCRSYHDFVSRYLEKSAKLKAPPWPFDPKKYKNLKKNDWIKSWEKTTQKLIRRWRSWNASSFERYLAPHPLMGKILHLELLYFTHFHNDLHLRRMISKKNWFAFKVIAVQSIDECQALSELASQIWNEHYPKIIGQAQVDYMLEKFHGPEYILKQIEKDSFFYFLLQDKSGINKGYFAFQMNPSDCFISKLYLHSELRGMGLGKMMVDFIIDHARKEDKEKVWLTVNKHNEASISAYQKLHFSKVEDLVIDIGDGYVMDDFKFEKKLK